MNGIDLSGKIIFKVKFDNEIKKIIIHNDEINHNELLLMIQRIFSEKIKPNDELIIKYTDEENDLITIANDSDVSLALQTSKIVKLTVFLDEKENATSNGQEEEIKASEVIKELQHIRTSIDKFLDKFERYLKLDKKIDEITKTTNDVKLSGSSTTLINNDLHKEFDPLAKRPNDSNTLEVPNASSGSSAAQKFLPIQKNSRAETPDSIGSSEFSPNPKTKFPGQSNELNAPQPQPVPASYGQENQIHQQQQHFTQPVQSLNQPQHFQQQQQQQQQPQMPVQNQYAPSQGLKYPSQTSMMNQPQQYQPQQPQQGQYMPQQQNTQPIAHPSQIPNQQQIDPQLQSQYQTQQTPQPSAYYQQPNPNLPNPQQQQQPGIMQPGQQMMPNMANPTQPTPPMPGGYTGFNMQTPNPYSQKNPNMALGRPPSATAHYQQGYK